MGAKDSKPSCISYEDAVRRVSEAELSRLRDAFKRSSNLSGFITKQTFIKEILGEYVPLRLAEHIFQACGGSHKGIGFKDLLCGLVLLTKGRRDEKIRFIFSLYANEAGTHVHKDEMVRLVQACDGGYVSEAIADCFLDGDKVSYEDFCNWVDQHKDATSLTRWLLSEPCSVSLSNELETPTFYQTLAGVTHLEEKDIIELEKRYWHLKGQSTSGKFDLYTLTPLISPPIPFQLCQGIFNAFDENRDGHIDFKEMACGISACCKGPVTERQKFCFKVFDEDRDGFLSRSEVNQMVRALLFVSCETASLNPSEEDGISTYQAEEEVRKIFETCDSNKIGAISLDEYLVWTVGQSLPLDFLSLLFQVCHIVFGLRPESKTDEGEIIRSWIDREERHGLKVGHFWYLISMDWWRSWNDYIDYQMDTNGPLLCGMAGSLKRSSKQQKRVEASVAHAPEDNGNVCLSSIVSFAEDALVATSYSAAQPAAAFQTSPEFFEGTLHHAGSASSLCSKGLLSPEMPRTPSHSPGLTRKITSVPPQRPPSIDNSSLIVPNTLKAMILTGEGGKLRRHMLLLRSKDFEIVPEPVWRTLHQWYGGSPALPRQVILPSHSNSPELELHPYTLKLFRHHITTVRQPVSSWSGVVSSVASVYGGSTNAYANQLVSVPKRYLAYLATFSRMSSLKHVFEFLCIRLRLRPEDTRLWLYRDDNNLCLLDDEYLTLEQLGFQDNEQILIEVRNKDITWPEEMSNLLNSRLDQKQLGPAEKGATGLNNLGNTCFMNAALQCVSNTRPLTLYFTSNRHLYELNRTNPLGMKGHIAKRYGDLVHELWSGTSRTIAPLKLRWTIGKYAPRFNGFQQHDSQELLAFLMDGLHEDLNRVHEKPYVELKDSDGRPDTEVAQEAWENHILRNRSIIVDLFHGQLQSSVTCKVCGHVSVRFDPFNYLSLPLPMESYIHLEVTVVKLDGSVPTKYGLRLNHDDKYFSLKQQLGLLCGLQSQQMVIAEVFGAHIKALPSDEQKIHSVMGGKLFVYELPLFPTIPAFDEAREPQTLTQIQRMTQTGVQNRRKKDEPNGVVFKIGDSVPECNGPPTLQSCSYDSCMDYSLCSSQSSSSGVSSGPPSSLSYQGQLMGGAPHWSPPPLSHHPHNRQWSPPSSSHHPHPGQMGHNSNSTFSLSSSLISNASVGDLTDGVCKNFIIAYHRKMMRQDVYFLSSQKTRPTLFGLPLVLPYDEDSTHQDLYQMVWTQVSRLVSPLPPSETSMPNHAQDCDDSLGYEYPFTLKAVQKDGLLCAWCSWYRFCRGCKIDCCDADFSYSTAYIAIDWDPTALHLRYQASQEREIFEHESVERTRQQQSSPIGLQDCLEAFTNEEHLGEEEKYYCSKCKEHQMASKKLQIWRLPPVLIVHLKRFQLLNGRWVKSHKIVRFPFTNFNPTEYLSPVPRDAVLAATQASTEDLTPTSSSGGSTSPDCVRDSKPLVNGDIYTSQFTARKDSTGQASGQSSGQESGQSSGHSSGQASGQSTGHSSVKSTGHSSGQASGQSSGQTSGQSTGHSSVKSTGHSSGQASGQSSGQASGLVQDFHQHRLKEGYNPYKLKYRLYAIACHSGILGGGHYVSYACNPNFRWYCYNDSSCKEIQPDQIDADSAYMLFYEREGLNYDSYLPNVEGRIPDTKEIDEEFENDFRKVCCLQ